MRSSADENRQVVTVHDWLSQTQTQPQSIVITVNCYILNLNQVSCWTVYVQIGLVSTTSFVALKVKSYTG